MIDIGDIEDETTYTLDAAGNVAFKQNRWSREKRRDWYFGKPRWLASMPVHNFLRKNTLFASLLYGGLLDALSRPSQRAAQWTLDPEVFEAFGREGLAKAEEHMNLLAEPAGRASDPSDRWRLSVGRPDPRARSRITPGHVLARVDGAPRCRLHRLFPGLHGRAGGGEDPPRVHPRGHSLERRRAQENCRRCARPFRAIIRIPVASDLAPIKDKTLPQNLEAERTVLGAIVVDNAAFNGAAELLSRDDFYREAHRRIFEAMANLAERSQPIDLVTLKEELTRISALEAVGGAAYIASLVDGVPRITNIEDWCRIIKEKAVLRNLIHASNRIAQAPTRRRTIPRRSSIRPRRPSSRSRSAASATASSHPRDRQGELPHHRPARPVAGRGHGRAHRLRGPRRQDERPAEGRPHHRGRAPGHGQDVALPEHRPARRRCKAGETVGIFSLEMSKEQLVLRMLCSDARIDSHRLRTGRLTEKDWARLAKALRRSVGVEDLHRRLGLVDAARDAREMPAPEGGARARAS